MPETTTAAVSAPVLERRSLGSTGLEVTTMGFGGASIGNLFRAVDDETARAAVDAAYDAGVRYFDTAPHYGVGLSERRLGRALADRDRASYVLSTKVGRLLVPHDEPSGTDLAEGFDTPDDLRRVRDYSAAGVRRSLEESLERLGLDRIDVALVHDADDHMDQALDEALPELARLRDEGVVGAIGVGMNGWREPLRCVEAGAVDVVMLAGRWTLLDRTGRTLLDACAERGVSVLAAAPFNSGLLSRAEPDADTHFDYAAPDPALVDAARQLAALARDHGTTLPHLALHFPLRHRAVASVVTGQAKPSHARTSAAWLTTPVPEAVWPEAESIVQGVL
ncbi:aldo/keto reductase [Nocardioides flavescens]|uniref:Aldo/keto reductase n=1 Tax=Nocardioides flavescens TaxID=2691959 RepID=A0A6L7EUA9_9ACTN|nr:aldo/keto reductase [Nocardioides flavescens]MXG89256.1 aldo/keto reductase [Nocardioides flavescens]